MLAYINQTEDQCNTTKGLELFRQAIALYEDGSHDDQNDDDDDFTSGSSIIKRQKLSSSNDIFNSKNNSVSISVDKQTTSDGGSSESPVHRVNLFSQHSN